MNWKQIEQTLLNDAAAWLEANKATIEADVTGPILTVVGGGVKIVEGFFAKLPFGLGALLDAALNAYVAQFETNIAQYEGQGIDYLANLLKKIAAGL